MLATVIVALQAVTLPVLMSRAEEVGGASDDAADETAEPEPEPAIAPQEFSGDQRGQTGAFPIEGGLTVFDVEHNGGGNFIVVLNDAEGQRVTGLVNVIGGFDGSMATYADAGDYRIEVIGSDWSVTVRQPRYDGGASLPLSLSGQGMAATEPFEVAGPGDGAPGGQATPAGQASPGQASPGQATPAGQASPTGQGDDEPEPRTVTFAITHRGEGNVRMTLLDENGRRAEGIVNDRNRVDTTTQVEVVPGVYLLNVQAAGRWTVEIR